MRNPQTLLVALGLTWSAAAFAQAPIWLWATALKGGSDVQARGIVAHALNGCFIHGSFNESLHLPFDTLVAATATDYFLVHVDSLGAAAWAVQFANEVVSLRGLPNGGASCLVAYEGSTAVQGQLVSGSTEGVSLLRADFDADGTLLTLLNLTAALVGEQMEPVLYHHDPTGGIAMAGTCTDSIAVLGNWVDSSGVFVARIAPDGTLAYASSVQGSMATGLTLSETGNVLLNAATLEVDGPLLSLDSEGSTIWSATIEMMSAWPRNPLAYRPSGQAVVGLHWPSAGPVGGTSLSVREYDLVGAVTTETWATDPNQWNNRLLSLHAMSDGGALTSGLIVGALTFGTQSLNSSGPDGFVARISSNGAWEWVLTETAGYVFGLHAAPSPTSRIYVSSWSDGGVQFGAHAVPHAQGNFQGIVACLGDVTLSSNTRPGMGPVAAWPNPTSDVLHVEMRSASPIRILDAQGRIVQASQGIVGTNTINVRDLKSGPYAIAADHWVSRFIKE